MIRHEPFFTCKNCGEEFYEKDSIKVKRGYKYAASCPKCNSLENTYTIPFRLSDFDTEITTEIEPLTETKSEPKFKAGDRVFNKVIHKWVNIIEFDLETGLYIVRYDDGLQGRSLESELTFEDDEETKSIDFTIKATDTKGKVEVVIPEGYGYVVENDKLYFITKKKEYPKTYEECCVDLGLKVCPKVKVSIGDTPTYREHIVETFIELLACRDAYLKRYEIEMKLNSRWTPDYEDLNTTKFCITTSRDKVIKVESSVQNYVFAFPTKEMRDAFYESFKELIEQCKELL